MCPESREMYAWSRDGGAWGRKNDRSDVDLVPSMSLPSTNEVFFGTQIQHRECLDAITKRRSASQQLARILFSGAMLALTITSSRHEFLKSCTNADGALTNDAHRAAHSHFLPKLGYIWRCRNAGYSLSSTVSISAVCHLPSNLRR